MEELGVKLTNENNFLEDELEFDRARGLIRPTEVLNANISPFEIDFQADEYTLYPQLLLPSLHFRSI